MYRLSRGWRVWREDRWLLLLKGVWAVSSRLDTSQGSVLLTSTRGSSSPADPVAWRGREELGVACRLPCMEGGRREIYRTRPQSTG